MHIFLFVCHSITAGRLQCKKKGDSMAKFKIPENPPTVNKTIRFPGNIIEEVEQAIQGKDCTFSSFVIAAVRAALEDLK